MAVFDWGRPCRSELSVTMAVAGVDMRALARPRACEERRRPLRARTCRSPKLRTRSLERAVSSPTGWRCRGARSSRASQSRVEAGLLQRRRGRGPLTRSAAVCRDGASRSAGGDGDGAASRSSRSAEAAAAQASSWSVTLAHGGDDDHGLEAAVAGGRRRCEAVRFMADGVLDGGAAELHDDDLRVRRAHGGTAAVWRSLFRFQCCLGHSCRDVLLGGGSRSPVLPVELAEHGEELGVEDGGAGRAADACCGRGRRTSSRAVEQGRRRPTVAAMPCASHAVEAGLGAVDFAGSYSTGCIGARRGG